MNAASSKIVFYGLFVLLLGSLLGVIYLLVDPFESKVTQTALEKISKTVVQKGIVSETRSESSSLSPSAGTRSGTSFSSKSQRVESELKFSAEVQAQVDILKSLFSQGRTDDALRKVLELRAEFPDEIAYKAIASDLLFSKGEYSEAADVLAELIHQNPQNYSLRARQADALDLSGRNEESYSSFSQILSEDPSNGKAMLGILKQAEILDRRQEAQVILENAFGAKPSVDGALVLADVYAMESDTSRRDQMYEKAKQMDPNHPLLNRVLAVDAIARGQWERAEDYVDLAVSNSDDMDGKVLSVEAFTDAALLKGRKDLAQRALQKLRDMGAPDYRIEQVEERLSLFEDSAQKPAAKN